MKKNIFLGLLLSLWGFHSMSQSFPGTGDTIPDDGNSIDFIISASGLPNSIDTLSFGLESVCLDITHSWDADLEATLIAPDGSSVLLFANAGYDGDNFTGTCFRSDATESIINSWAPFSGDFRPVGSLGKVNNGQNPNGDWTLRIYDTYPWADWGTLNSWSITFGNDPATLFTIHSSDIPIVIVDTYGQPIIDDPKTTAHMGIIDNGYGNRNFITDDFNAYNGSIGIELRGSSSQMFPKKSYGLETRDFSGNDSDAIILGMPAESDWCLIANYSDKTMMRNWLAYNFSSFLGNYAPRTRYCELIINGEYQGVYMFTEKIKRDADRVDIAKLDSNEVSGDDVTGGYIIKIDKQTGSGGDGWTSSYPPMSTTQGQTVYFMYDYPKPEDIVQPQKEYIQACVDSFETALYSSNFTDTSTGYNHYMDVKSFIDYFIIDEISKNVDGYRLSTYLHKDKYSNGGKLHIGPVWDYDLAWWNANYCGGDDFTGWAYKFGEVCPDDWWQIPGWWNRLMQDTLFTEKLKCRWDSLRAGILDTVNIFHNIDSVASYLDESQQRNFYQWPIIGYWIWPNPSPLATTYSEEISALKNWIRNRMEWLDANMPGICIDHTSIAEYSHSDSEINIYPNPSAGEYIYIESEIPFAEQTHIGLYDFTGKCIYSAKVSHPGNTIKIPPVSADGIYLIRVTSGSKIYSGKIIIKF